MKRWRVAITAVIALAAPVGATMTVGTFVAKASALRANPLAAFTSPDFPLLRTEAQTATAQLKADRDARRAAGKPPIACVPEGQSIGITDMIDGLAALPPAAQKLPLKDGYARVIAQRFPCR
ncbi:hypothetical protein [uncultured Sphingomonas sp.]|uniref:hypothetical protein n=1 Tax=uncultured Sphingomonas sp. TaxID=158754 RepID=UPI0035CBF39C